MIEVVLSQSGLYTIGSEATPDGLSSVFRTSDLNWTFLEERIGESVKNGFILSMGSVPPSVKLTTVGCRGEEVEGDVRLTTSILWLPNSIVIASKNVVDVGVVT